MIDKLQPIVTIVIQLGDDSKEAILSLLMI